MKVATGAEITGWMHDVCFVQDHRGRSVAAFYLGHEEHAAAIDYAAKEFGGALKPGERYSFGGAPIFKVDAKSHRDFTLSRK